MRKNSKNEISILKRSDIIIGRTDWDFACCCQYGLEAKYRTVNENLRDSFYHNHWSYQKCKKHTIFCSQGALPYKGLHVLLKAIAILKNRFPDIQLVIAGYDLTKTDTVSKRVKRSGYAKYLIRLIRDLDIQKNICFTGILNEREMCAEYLHANLFVQCSCIENSPNSLGEAISLGMPIIASLVGGTEKYIKHKNNGILYPSGDSTLLAYYIEYIFENCEWGKQLGENAYATREYFYNREKNALDLIAIYDTLREPALPSGSL